MQRDNIIILTQMCDFRQEAWGSLAPIVDSREDWSYTEIRKIQRKLERQKKPNYPFEYKGWQFNKVPYNQIFPQIKNQ